MDKLIEKIKKYFGDKYTYKEGEMFMALWIQGQYSNHRENVKSVFLPQADYMDKIGELENYLKTL
jgi:hypothetical protein